MNVDLLRDFQTKAQQLKDLLKKLQVPPPSPSAYGGPIPKLNLIFPHDIFVAIDDLGLQNHLSDQMKSKFTERIIQSQQACIESFQRTCHTLPGPTNPDFVANLAKIYQNTYNNHQISQFRDQIITSKALIMSRKKLTHGTSKPAFNNEYTPHLEKYFEQNAYPSRPDRILLAKKSSMTERQIEVWFQNHRNRSKKEGIPLKRMNPQQLASSELSGTMVASPSEFRLRADSPSQKTTSNDNDRSTKGLTNALNEHFPIDITPGLYTFPIPYIKKDRSFSVGCLPSCESTPRFPPPNWPRKPASQSSSPSSATIEELINMFASKLSIRRGLGSKSTYGPPRTKPWFLSTITIPSPAPHPALIRTTIPIYPSSPTPFSSAIHSIPMAISHVSSISRPSTPSRSKRFWRPRKAAPFPFRSPQKPLRMRPAKTSLPAFERYSSRTISFTSVSSASSTQSRTSSDSSRSSPGPSTPPQSPSNNPVEIHDPFLIEVPESAPSDSYDDIFAGIANPHFSDIQNLDDFLNNGAMYTDKFFQDSLNFPFPDPQYATA